MPSVSSSATVLVTGANGFYGLWVVRALLERGYTVKGAVRSPTAADTLKRFVKDKYPARAAKFQTIIVPDITAAGAFDDAVKDVSAVVHTASPMTFAEEDPEAYTKPAVGGTIGILQSVSKHGTNVKRVVITSSVAAVFRTDAPPGLYAEDVWNDDAVRIVAEQGRKAPGDIKYMASKTLAERAAWGFMHEHKDAVKFDLCTILPSWSMGIPSNDPSSPAEMGSTPRYLYDQLFAVPAPAQREPPCFNYVDVHDAVEMHVRALEVEAAGGERFIASSHVCSWQDWLNAASALGVLPKLDKGDPKAAESCPPHPTCSNEKAQRLLGMKFRTVPETFKEVYEYFDARGWLADLQG
ncbi:NAD(P)-binding protein [Cubamyces lactineus]|nr:NAD(P)-binding protein [Cubamyces lactineus]